MMFDLSILLYLLLAIYVMTGAIACLAAVWVLRRAVLRLKASRDSLQGKRTPGEVVHLAQMCQVPGPAAS